MPIKKGSITNIVACILIVGCFSVWGFVLTNYSVDVPRADQWDTPGRQILAYSRGELDLGLLAATHNESRKVAPNLVSLALFAARGHWDLRGEIYFGWALGALMVLLVATVAAQSEESRPTAAIVAAVYASLLWSAHTREFHLFGATFERLIPELAALGMVLAFIRLGPGWSATLISAGAALVAQYSFAGGICVWALAILSLALCDEPPGRRRLAKMAAIVFLGSLSTWFYFDRYEQPASLTPWQAIFEESVLDLVRFPLLFIGNAVTSSNRALGIFWAVVILVTFTVLSARFIIHPRAGIRDRVNVAWVVLGSYSLFQTIATLIARLPMGLHHALRSDYISHPLFLWTATVALLFSWASESDRSGDRTLTQTRRNRFLRLATLGFACAMGLTLALPTFWKHVRLDRQRAEFARTCFLLMDYSRDDSCLDLLYPPIASRAALFRRSSPLLRPSRIEPRSTTGPDAGRVAEWAWEAGTLMAAGDAYLGRRDADAVVVAITEGAELRIIAIFPVGLSERPRDAKSAEGARNTNWQVRIPLDESAIDVCKLLFLAADNTRGLLFPLASTQPEACASAMLRGISARV